MRWAQLSIALFAVCGALAAVLIVRSIGLLWRARFSVRAIAGGLLGACVGLSWPLLLALTEVRVIPELATLVPAMLGFIIAMPGWPFAGRGNLTFAAIVLFWALLGAVVSVQGGRRSSGENP